MSVELRGQFRPSPRPVVWVARQPSWMFSTRASGAALRRIWQVRPSEVSPRCWKWISSGYGPPWQQGESR